MLSIYVAGALLTSCYAAYNTGKHNRYMRIVSGQSFDVNWTNNFFHSLLWPAWWCSIVGDAVVKRQNPRLSDACQKLGIDPSKLPHG